MLRTTRARHVGFGLLITGVLVSGHAFAGADNVTVSVDVAEDTAVAAANAAENALDEAFADRDIETIRALQTPDHISVTPYYDGPQSVDDQIASLSELDYGETIIGAPSVVFLSPDVALRTFVAELDGSFRGEPLPARAFINETVVRRDGQWTEAFFQITTLEE